MYKFILTAMLLSGCTDAMFTKVSTIGSSAEVKVYSGGKIIFWGESTGQVSSERNSDGYFAKWKIKQLEGPWHNVKPGDVRAASVSSGIIMIYED